MSQKYLKNGCPEFERYFFALRCRAKGLRNQAKFLDE